MPRYNTRSSIRLPQPHVIEKTAEEDVGKNYLNILLLSSQFGRYYMVCFNIIGLIGQVLLGVLVTLVVACLVQVIFINVRSSEELTKLAQSSNLDIKTGINGMYFTLVIPGKQIYDVLIRCSSLSNWRQEKGETQRLIILDKLEPDTEYSCNYQVYFRIKNWWGTQRNSSKEINFNIKTLPLPRVEIFRPQESIHGQLTFNGAVITTNTEDLKYWFEYGQQDNMFGTKTTIQKVPVKSQDKTSISVTGWSTRPQEGLLMVRLVVSDVLGNKFYSSGIAF